MAFVSLKTVASGQWLVVSSQLGVLENRKGCDFGYALACYSCERVAGVEACTVTALDVITAFAIPDPG